MRLNLIFLAIFFAVVFIALLLNMENKQLD